MKNFEIEINKMLDEEDYINIFNNLTDIYNSICNKSSCNGNDSREKSIKNLSEEFIKIKDLEIFPFQTPHDAADPCGFNIISDGKKISIATDLGNINSSVFNCLKESNCILLESNYDPNVLQCSHYPYYLKQRICSSNGHLSNSLAGKTISKLIDSGLEKALLIHLSKENNFPELAKQTVLNEIKTVEDFPIYVAPRDKPSQFFEVS